MKKNKKHPEFIYMVVSLTAFVFTAIIIIVFSHISGISDNISFETIAVMIFIGVLLIPAMIKAYAYSNLFKYDRNENNFNVSYVINKYKLTGWIKGKYTFLDAVSAACNGEHERGFELYVKCLGEVQDKRLRLACYKDMITNLSKMDNSLRLVPYIRKGCEEFPDETDLFEYVAQYLTWYPFANEKEALEWFDGVLEKTTSDRIKYRAHYYMGYTSLYRRDYESADRHFSEAYSLISAPPCYLLIDMAVCKACLGDYDMSRQYAVQAAALTDNHEDVEYIGEKLEYLFKTTTEAVNPETEKLINELKRRRDSKMEDSVQISDIEKYNAAVERAKQNSQ